MNLRLLLLPFTLIYAAIMMVRNRLYDWHLLRSVSFSKPVICVGNITVGGTGKTPFIEHLISILQPYQPSVVSRGYRRKTHGLVVATSQSTAIEIGDEPCQMHHKHPQVPIAVCEDRALAIAHLATHTSTNVVLMDDGFQHRSVRAGLYILITDYARPMWSDFTFPAGNMREPWQGRHRANIIVVNKCRPDLSLAERDKIKAKLSTNSDVFFSTIEYGSLTTFDGKTTTLPSTTKILAVAGIGRPEPFFSEIERHFADVKRISFADHHRFAASEIEQISQTCQSENRVLITTEKDAMRLREYVEQLTINVVYLPIQLRILFGEAEKLNTKILQYVRQFDRANK